MSGTPTYVSAESAHMVLQFRILLTVTYKASVVKTKRYLPEDNVAQILSFRVFTLGSHQVVELWAGRNLRKAVLSLSLSLTHT